MTIVKNIAALADAKRRVQAHPMCAKYEEQPAHLLITYPPGFRVDGLRVSLANGATWAHCEALRKMEQHWRDA